MQNIISNTDLIWSQFSTPY